MENETFFDRIKQWVKNNNTTIDALMYDAFNGEKTKATYYGWRKRKEIPSGSFIWQLAQYMNVTCDWLIAGNKSSLTSKYQELINSLEKLDDFTKHNIEIMVSALAEDVNKNINKNIKG